MLVEVYGSCVPDGPGGLKKLEYERTGIFNQVSKYALGYLLRIAIPFFESVINFTAHFVSYSLLH